MGGYQIIDFVGIDLKDGGSNLLIFNLLNNTTRKVILGTSLVYDNVELKDEYFTCEVDGTSYVLKNASFSITIASDGTITCEKTSSGGGSSIVDFESIEDLETYLLTNYEVDDNFYVAGYNTDLQTAICGRCIKADASTISWDLANSADVSGYNRINMLSLDENAKVIYIIGYEH